LKTGTTLSPLWAEVAGQWSWLHGLNRWAVYVGSCLRHGSPSVLLKILRKRLLLSTWHANDSEAQYRLLSLIAPQLDRP
jgi:hypothetical protein